MIEIYRLLHIDKNYYYHEIQNGCVKGYHKLQNISIFIIMKNTLA